MSSRSLLPLITFKNNFILNYGHISVGVECVHVRTSVSRQRHRYSVTGVASSCELSDIGPADLNLNHCACMADTTD